MRNLSIKYICKLYDGNDTTHAIDHVLRVTRLAVHIARLERADIAIVRTASLLHDIARSEPNHHLAGASRAREILSGYSLDFINSVAHCIESHSFGISPYPETIEAKCLCDADKLDAIGAIGVARTFAVAGMYNNRLWVNPLNKLYTQIGDDRKQYRNKWGKSKDYTPGHEYICKLEELASQMYTDAAQQIASERYRFMTTFFLRLDEEAMGKS